MLTVAAPGAAAQTPPRKTPTAMELLKRYEKLYTSYKALKIKYKLYIQGAHKATFTAFNRPNGQRITRLSYPGDVKGMQILIQSSAEMYIYLPAFRKVRRIAGHVQNQGFLGSGFSYDDMAISTWSNDYRVTLKGSSAKHHILDLRAIPGRRALYKRIELSVNKDSGFAHAFRYFNRHGKNYKTQKFLNYKCSAKRAPHCNPRRIQMIEHTRGNRLSELRLVRARYRSGFPNRMFTVRHLLRSAN